MMDVSKRWVLYTMKQKGVKIDRSISCMLEKLLRLEKSFAHAVYFRLSIYIEGVLQFVTLKRKNGK